MKAILRNVRISPKKVNLVADLVRKKPVSYALGILKFIPKKAAKPLHEAIQSAASNATQNFKQKRESLIVSKIVVNEGPTLKRFRPVSRGRTHPIRKRVSHITVEVSVKEPAKTEPAKTTKQASAPSKAKKTS